MNCFKRQGGEGLHQRTGDPGFNQILLLVVIDIKVIEHIDTAAIVRADLIVVQVDHQGQQIILGRAGSGSLRTGTGHFEHGHGHDIRNTQHGRQTVLVRIQEMTNAVLKQQHLAQHGFGGEQGRIARTLIQHPVIDNLLDQSLRRGNVVFSGNGHLHGEQIVILPNGADMLLRNAVIGAGGTTVADQDRTGDFLIQHHPHFALQPGHNVKVGDIDHIVAIQLLLLVDCLRISGPLEQREHFFLLPVALDITQRTSFVLGNVSEHALNPGEPDIMHAVHNLLHPFLATLDELGRIIIVLVFREQPVNLINAVIFRMTQHGFLQAAQPLRIAENGIEFRMAQGVVLLFVHAAIKHVLLHISVSFHIRMFDFVIFVGFFLVAEVFVIVFVFLFVVLILFIIVVFTVLQIFQSIDLTLLIKSTDNCLLIFIHTIQHGLNIQFLFHQCILLVFFHSVVINLDLLIVSVDAGLFIIDFIRSVAVREIQVLNPSALIGGGQNQ